MQLRCKGREAAWIAALGRAAQARWQAAGLPLCLIINDQVEVARALGAMVHLGQEDGPDPDIPFGRSTHDIADVEAQARAGRAAYIGFGPVFPSVTKAGAKEARGVEALAEAVRASPVPVVAIGGIGLANVAEVQATGAAGWAVIGAIWGAPDPLEVIRRLRRAGR